MDVGGRLTNHPEGLNEVIKRRFYVVGVLPDVDFILRLVGSDLTGIGDQ